MTDNKVVPLSNGFATMHPFDVWPVEPSQGRSAASISVQRGSGGGFNALSVVSHLRGLMNTVLAKGIGYPHGGKKQRTAPLTISGPGGGSHAVDSNHKP